MRLADFAFGRAVLYDQPLCYFYAHERKNSIESKKKYHAAAGECAASRHRKVQRSYALLAAIVIVALLLAAATLAAGVRADLVEPALGSVSLGPLSIGAAIENRICLQRVLRRACAPPIYTLTLRLEEPGNIWRYQLLRLPISERYAFYP